MAVVKEFKYLGTVYGRRNKRAVKGRSVIGSLARVMKGRNVSMEVKRGLRNSILLQTLIYGSEMCSGNELPERGMSSDNL